MIVEITKPHRNTKVKLTRQKSGILKKRVHHSETQLGASLLLSSFFNPVIKSSDPQGFDTAQDKSAFGELIILIQSGDVRHRIRAINIHM